MKFDLAGLLFPRRCPVCHEAVEERGALICAICRTRLPAVREPSCRKCGKPLGSEEQEYCGDCRKKAHYYRQGRAPFLYDRVMRESIAWFKYRGRKEYAGFYAEEIFRKCKKEMGYWNAQALIPIPLHASRRRKRGYNQAELLAKELSLRSGIPVDTRILIRRKKTRAQKDLDDRERRANIKGAFETRSAKVPYETVILVDDIYTTGSTVDEAARILRENGVRAVYFLCICVGSSC